MCYLFLKVEFENFDQKFFKSGRGAKNIQVTKLRPGNTC